MSFLTKGAYQARLAQNEADIDTSLGLRSLAFRAGARPDRDAFDALCQHMLITHLPTETLVCSFRLMPLASGSEIRRSYSAQHYELGALAAYDAPMVEMGRFCIHPDWTDADILRIAWGAMTQFVDRHGIRMLFGCSSFHGTDAEAYLDAFALLNERHIAPRRWLPRVKAPHVFRFARGLARFHTPDRKRGLRLLPPLLRTYLLMGGWVSDHAVVDRDLGTLHVFTGLEIAAVPDARARLLRAVATPSMAPSRA